MTAKEFFKSIFNKENIKYIIYAVLIVVIVILILNNGCQRSDLRKYKNNEYALRDSLHTEKLKNGELLSYQQTLILDKSELEEYLGISKNEVKDLEKKLDASLKYISKLEGEIKIDTLLLHDSIYYTNDSTVVLFKYLDKWMSINGTTVICDSVPSTRIDSMHMDVPLKIGYAEDYMGYKAFVTTDNPYVTFGSIQGALLDKQTTKKKRWNVGIQAGFGAGYDIIHNKFAVGPMVGLGISYGLDF